MSHRWEDNDMQESFLKIANTGDTSRPWLIAICMIVSIVGVVALFVMGRKGNDSEDEEEE